MKRLMITAELRDWFFPLDHRLTGYIFNDTRRYHKDGEYVTVIQISSVTEYDDHFIAKTGAGTVYKLCKDQEQRI